ncbi:MAG TPA: hypothetical protein VM802_13075 [Chitinophaga sp.]|uniref:hypothetical protein n=1 Tax=Chitinophaga sp. TaxID=1869181 RepID=UPI002B7396AE|nr:hypothetical protein [Chitinophaga sp.]HVI45801.1 hypothetical protein [Chitinophaga sp.]
MEKTFFYPLFFITVTAMLLFSACGKNATDKLQSINAGTQKAAVENTPKWLLSKVIYTTKNNVSNWTATYTYNNQNKPINKQIKGKRIGAVVDETILFFYDNAGRISRYKSSKRWDTINIAYDVQGRILKSKYPYYYVNDTVSYIKYTDGAPKDETNYLVYYFYDSKGNLKQIRDFENNFFPLNDTFHAFYFVATVFGKYDNNANANAAINVSPTWLTSYQYQSETSYESLAPFNFTNNYQEITNSLNSSIVKQTATYNAEGLVTRLDGVSTDELTSSSYVYRFEYVLAK